MDVRVDEAGDECGIAESITRAPAGTAALRRH